MRINDEFFAIFEAGGWTEFFQLLNGFHRETTLQFVLNLTENHSDIRGLWIEVSEVIVAEFPQIGRSWFGRRTPNVSAV